VVSSTPRPLFTPGKDPIPIVQEAGWAPGPVWTGGNFFLKGKAIPLHAWTSPEVSRKLRLPDFKTIGI